MRIAPSLVLLAAWTGLLAAQPVKLVLNPRAGDTLVLRIEQQTELIGSIIRAQRDSSVTVRASMLIFARAIVERSDSTHAIIMGIADSITSSGPAVPSAAGRRVQMKLRPDGSSELINADAALGNVVSAFLAEMPATLPRGQVSVGDTWTREVPVPLEQGAPLRAFKTTFRLDSLSAGRQMAYISMRGTLVEQETATSQAARAATSGDMRGRMVLDRARGWIIDSIATITVRAVVQRPMDNGVPPMNLEIRITQQMRTLNTR
jgi:hypothetical protein